VLPQDISHDSDVEMLAPYAKGRGGEKEREYLDNSIRYIPGSSWL